MSLSTFLDVARKVSARKPILAMKAGRTMDGAKAAASHTGGLATLDVTTDLIFQKAGILSFHDEGELCQAAACFASQPIPKGNRVGIITNTGGPAVIGTDVLSRAGLVLPPLSRESVERLKESLLPEVSVRNPLDVLATANADHFRSALAVMADDEAIDSIYINFVTPFFVDNESIAREIGQASRQGKKPIVCNLMTDKKQFAGIEAILKEGGVPSYAFPGTTARALAALTKYGEIRRGRPGKARRFTDIDRKRAEAVLEAVGASGRKQLFADEAYRVLEAYSVPVAHWRMAADAGEADKAAKELGFPVVVKADSALLLHKSDAGGVVMGIEDGTALREAITAMARRIEAPDLRFLVQKELPRGIEVILGAKVDEEVGPMVMFGIGGVHVELFKDVAFRLCPVTGTEADEMIGSVKASRLFEGPRGAIKVDRKRVVEMIGRISQLVTDLPVIGEIDLNPVIVWEDGLAAADVRIVLKEVP